MRAIQDYLAEVQEKYKTGVAREHAYRPALQTLLESAGKGINAVNDAAQSDIGMPDFVVMSAEGNAPIGIVEAKDIGNRLNRTEKSAQLRRYMARRLAGIAREIAYYIKKDLDSSAPSQNLLKQKDAFEETLLPDLSHENFADMYAQTFAYGLFAARVNHIGDPAQFDLRGAAEDIPQTNPFLRKLFHHSYFDLGKRLTWMMESLVNALRRADMDDILADFGQRTQQTDPVVHFYETFLSAYNPALREQRGVY